MAGSKSKAKGKPGGKRPAGKQPAALVALRGLQELFDTRLSRSRCGWRVEPWEAAALEQHLAALLESGHPLPPGSALLNVDLAIEGFRLFRPGDTELKYPKYAKFMDALREVKAAIRRLEHEPAPPKPLTDAQQEAFNLIWREGPLTGPQIVNRLGISSESNFTTHYVPDLKMHGIRNRPRLGYYHPDAPKLKSKPA